MLTRVEISRTLNNSAHLEVSRKPGPVRRFIEAFRIHSSSQAEQPQISLHLVINVSCWQVKPVPAAQMVLWQLLNRACVALKYAAMLRSACTQE